MLTRNLGRLRFPTGAQALLAAIVRAKYLDDAFIGVPSMALERVQLELGHMGDWVRKMLGN